MRAFGKEIHVGGHPHQKTDGRGHRYFGHDPRIAQGDKDTTHGHYNPNNGYLRGTDGTEYTNRDGSPKSK